MKKGLSIVLGIGMLLCKPVLTMADEGMWLPMLVKRLNYEQMQKYGLKLTPEEIYSVNHASLKDAIVMLNGGMCTAEMVSPKGLMLTNHHCAYGVIQANSTVEHDYLTDGFWAMAMKEELPAEGMTASFLIEMRDVTDKILGDVSITVSGQEREEAVSAAINAVSEEVAKEFPAHYEIRVKDFFGGNEFYLFVYETFKDVRLVGAPPSSIGKYGGDTDNWMWPRHTGDFAMLRVYESPEGKPATYAEANVPHKPKHFLPVSLNGVDKGDFAMIMGYPGSTDRYLSSYGVNSELTLVQPARVKIRGERLAILKEDMDASDKVRIAYASKYAGISNYWKYFQGQMRGLKRLKVYDKKKALEEDFSSWVAQLPERKEIYGNVLTDLNEGYVAHDEIALGRVYLNEAVFGSEIIQMAFRAMQLEAALSAEKENPDGVKAAVEGLKQRAESFYEDYNAPTDKKVTAKMLELYHEDLPAELQPETLNEMFKKYDTGKGIADYVFEKSVFDSQAELNAFLEKPSLKKLQKDPAYQLASGFLNFYRSTLQPPLGAAYDKIGNADRLFIHGLREMNADKAYYPNANSTMRFTYGQVLDYYPADAVYYNYFTTLEGVMEKEDPTNDEFIVPAKLKELYKKKDYGRYAEDGKMVVCFLSNNDITGGNSGSPVINGSGELIGIAFDGNWEAMSGDIAFEHDMQRTISVDIRYVLFIIDKYAGAKHLVDEMTLVMGNDNSAEAKVSPAAMERAVEPASKEAKPAVRKAEKMMGN